MNQENPGRREKQELPNRWVRRKVLLKAAVNEAPQCSGKGAGQPSLSPLSGIVRFSVKQTGFQGWHLIFQEHRVQGGRQLPLQ